MAETLDEVLAHYGVKGMHWGVRKRGASAPASTDATKAKEHATTAKKHGTAALSNKELQLLVTRMNLERQYSSLKGETQVKKGQKVVRDIIGVGRTVNDVMTFINSPAGKLLKARLAK